MSAEAAPSAPAWLRQLERLINKILAQDEETLEALAGLRGKVIGLELSQTRLRFFLLPGAWGLRIQADLEADLEAGPDVWIKGTPANFLKLLRAARAEAPGLPADLQIMGDIALAQRFQAILRALDIDLEGPLARLAGDTLAVQISRLASGAGRYLSDSGRSLALNLSEYLRFEVQLLPDDLQVREFCDAVDTLRQDADRLEQRLARLEQRARAGDA